MGDVGGFGFLASSGGFGSMFTSGVFAQFYVTVGCQWVGSGRFRYEFGQYVLRFDAGFWRYSALGSHQDHNGLQLDDQHSV